MDNGAMIAQAGMQMFLNGYSTTLENSTVDQRFRIDQVEAPWIKPSAVLHRTNMGAESLIEIGDYMGRKAVFKHRIPKTYRNPELDSQIRLSRMRNEATMMIHLNDLGIAVPMIYDIDFPASLIVYEYVDGILLRERLLMEGAISTMESIAETATKMHTGGLSHGDFTAGNIIMKSDSSPYILDASLGKTDARPEDMAVDLYLFMESLRTHVPDSDAYFKRFIDRYRDGMNIFQEIMESFRDLEKRRRYV
jgi:N6-L-threonylcarbamoyladenine synthase/protein kinase Bud32